MDDLEHRRDIYGLSYTSWFLLGLSLLLFGLLWFAQVRDPSFLMFIWSLNFLAIWGLQVARVLKKQNERLERMEEAVASLQEERFRAGAERLSPSLTRPSLPASQEDRLQPPPEAH
jgi:hypothetical protein